MRILALEHHFPFFKDCVDGFKSLAHNVMVTKPGDDEIYEAISSFNPHLIFFIDHTGVKSKILRKIDIPVVSWFLDKPAYWMSPQDAFENLLIFVYDRIYIESLNKMGFKHVHHLPLATNPRVFKKMELSRGELEKYECDVSFVGASIRDYYFKYKELFKNPKDRVIADEVIMLQAENCYLHIQDILEEVEKLHNHSLTIKNSIPKDVIEMCLEGIASSIYRRRMIEAIKDLDLWVYGDPGWREIVGGGVRFCGSINYHTELPILYNATKIHLNLTRVQVKTTINQRPLDGSAAGCFVLSDYRRDLGILFDLEREVRFFRNKEEMRDLILYYLTHQGERKEYVMRARERVLKEHTFERRLEKMIKIASKVLSI